MELDHCLLDLQFITENSSRRPELRLDQLMLAKAGVLTDLSSVVVGIRIGTGMADELGREASKIDCVTGSVANRFGPMSWMVS
jgi:hypothetical protein